MYLNITHLLKISGELLQVTGELDDARRYVEEEWCHSAHHSVVGAFGDLEATSNVSNACLVGGIPEKKAIFWRNSMVIWQTFLLHMKQIKLYKDRKRNLTFLCETFQSST